MQEINGQEELVWTQALNALSEAFSVFTRKELTAYIAQYLRAAENKTDYSFANGDLNAGIAKMERSRPDPNAPYAERAESIVDKGLAAGKGVVALENGTVFTTPAVLQDERIISEIAREMVTRQPDAMAVQKAVNVLGADTLDAFTEFPADDETKIEFAENAKKLLTFPDLAILNGPPGTGKSTICSSMALAVAGARGKGGLLPEGAKIYATSSNPKAAASLADDLTAGLTVWPEPEMPRPLAENASEDEKNTHAYEMRMYEETKVRYDKAMRTLALSLGGVYASQAGEIFETVEERSAFYDGVRRAYNESAECAAQKALIQGTSLPDLIGRMNAGEIVRGSYVFVDEAGLMGRRDMRDLLVASAASGVRVLLVGDNLQIPPQEAGHPFDLVVKQVATREDGTENTACSLTTKHVLRQNSPIEAQAAADIRNSIAQKDPARGIYAYEGKTYTNAYKNADGSVDWKTEEALSFGKDDDAARDALADSYVSYRTAFPKKSSVVLTTTWEKADRLVETMRAKMKQAGLITGPETDIGGNPVATGDSLIFTAPVVLNGTEFPAGTTVACKVDEKNPNIVTFTAGKQKPVTVDIRRVDWPCDVEGEPAVKSALALPLALAQGLSKNRAFLSLTEGDTLDEPNGLVAFTRHQDQMSAFISQKAYADIDALAVDIVKKPRGRNASDYEKDASLDERKAVLQKKKDAYYSGVKAQKMARIVANRLKDR